MKKLSLLIAILCVGATVACAKDYSISLSAITSVHNLKLDPGAYTVRLQGSLVFFVDKHGKSVSALAKQERIEKKPEKTTIETNRDGDSARLTSIAPEGSEFKLIFTD
jgi:hypothetical protein